MMMMERVSAKKNQKLYEITLQSANGSNWILVQSLIDKMIGSAKKNQKLYEITLQSANAHRHKTSTPTCLYSGVCITDQNVDSDLTASNPVQMSADSRNWLCLLRDH